MKRVDVKKLSGGEILARDLYTLNYGTILMPKGTVLKKEYINRLELLGINTVYIKDFSKKKKSPDVRTESGLIEICQNQIRQVMERHIYKHNEELKRLCRMAENIILEAVNEEPLNDKIVEIQEADGDIYTHSMHVCTLSTMLAIRCGMEKEEVQDVLKGGLLHDIGLRYITVPYENVSMDRIPRIAQEEYKHHTLKGYNSLEKENWISPAVKDIILYHHERLNGSGYPFKMKGDRLIQQVKIVSICDAFDERVTGIGHERYHLQEALEFLRDNKGILFDKIATETFLKMIVHYPTGCVVKVNTGEIGRVVYQNKNMPERPVLLLIQDQNGMIYPEGREFDLMKELNVFIEEVIEKDDAEI